MLKVQILDRCPECEGRSMVYVGVDHYYDGRPFDRYRPCYWCSGSGKKPRWIPLSEFAKLLDDAISMEPNVNELEAEEPSMPWQAGRDAAGLP